MSDVAKELEQLRRDAEENLFNAHKAMAHAYMANAIHLEKINDYQLATVFYFDAGTHYRSSGLRSSNPLVKEADEGYGRCRYVLPNRFHVLKV